MITDTPKSDRPTSGISWRYKIRCLDRKTGKEVDPLIVTAGNKAAALKAVDGTHLMVLRVTAPGKLWVVAGVAVAIIAIALLFWACRDTWEADNRARLLTLKNEAYNLFEQGKQEEGYQKCVEFLSIVGDRNIDQRDLSEALSSVRKITAKRDADLRQQKIAEAERQQQERVEAAQRKPVFREKLYRDSKGETFTKSEFEARYARLQRMVEAKEDPYEKAYLEGVLKALSDEWERIKREQGE